MTKAIFETINILVIDDEAFMRTLITRLLRELGVPEVLTAADGKEGLDKLAREGGRVDLVICDLEMPNMDGFEFVEALRADKALPRPDVPVLILTGHSDAEYVRKAVELGIHGFLVKPVSREALTSRMEMALKSPAIDPARLKPS